MREYISTEDEHLGCYIMHYIKEKKADDIISCVYVLLQRKINQLNLTKNCFINLVESRRYTVNNKNVTFSCPSRPRTVWDASVINLLSVVTI